MAIIYELRTFKDIVDAVMETCQIQSTDAIERNRVKRNIQMVYYDEVLAYKQWPWLRGTSTVQNTPYFGTGTASVTTGSCVVTLTDAPQPSKRDYFFSVDGSNVKYRILAHTAGSATLVLSTPYGESTSSTVRFKIFTDALPLPNDLEEVIEVRHAHHVKPLTNLGLQEYRRLESTGPKSEGFPAYYTTTDYKDPETYAAISGLPATASRSSAGLAKTIQFAASLGASEATALLRPGSQIEVIVSGADGYRYSGRAVVSRLFTTTLTNDTITYTHPVNWQESSTADTTIVVRRLESESFDRYREMLVYPAIFNSRINLELDYIKSALPLENDSDEPSLPRRDRIVLYYGALYHTWTRKRNPNEAASARTLFQAKLDKMAGKTEDSPDKPQFVPSRLYMSAKRGGQRFRSRTGDGIQFAGAGATTAPSGNPNQVAVFGTDGHLQSSIITTTELGYLDGAASNIQDQIDNLLIESPNGNRAVISQGDGTVAESPITSTELLWLDDVEKATVTLTNDSSDVLVDALLSSHTAIVVDYVVSRGTGNREAGRIMVTSDGTTNAISVGGVASVGDVGVTWDVGVFGGALEIYWYTTNTGTDATCSYRAQLL